MARHNRIQEHVTYQQGDPENQTPPDTAAEDNQSGLKAPVAVEIRQTGQPPYRGAEQHGVAYTENHYRSKDIMADDEFGEHGYRDPKPADYRPESSVPVHIVGLSETLQKRQWNDNDIVPIYFTNPSASIALQMSAGRLIGWSVYETSNSSAARAEITDSNTAAAGPLVIPITLLASESIREWQSHLPIPFLNGLQFNFLSGAMKGVLWVLLGDPEKEPLIPGSIMNQP